MGQYHRIYNLDKKETLGAIASGIKLQEMSSDYYTMTALMVLMCNSNGRGGGDLVADADGSAAIAAISGRWAGDRIVVQGDYAKETDPGFISESERESFEDITELCVLALKDGGTGIEKDRGFLINESLRGRASRMVELTYTTPKSPLKPKVKLFKTHELMQAWRDNHAHTMQKCEIVFIEKRSS